MKDERAKPRRDSCRDFSPSAGHMESIRRSGFIAAAVTFLWASAVKMGL
jgi:hypothetical protein